MAQTVEEKKEQRAVDYLRTQLTMDQPETVLQIYIQIIEQDVFHTPVGFAFLQELKDFLLENAAIDNGRIPDFVIPETQQQSAEKQVAGNTAKGKAKQTEKAPSDALGATDLPKEKSDTKGKGKKKEKKAPAPVLFLSLLLNVVLIAMVVVMFALTLTSDSPNILNYKNELEDEYASWDEELTMREQAVKEREAAVEQAQQAQEAEQQSTDAQPQDTTTEQMQSTEGSQNTTTQPSQSTESTTQQPQWTENAAQDGTL